MNLRADKTGNVIVLSPPVRVDHANATEFGEGLSPWIAACKREGCGIVLDMQGVEYISSVGLRALMLAAKQIRAQGGRIGIAAPTPVVREVFEISRFHLVIPVYDSVPAAVAEVGGGGVKAVFWGTRGSLPVALTAREVRAKLVAALTGAIGRTLDTPERIAAYVDGELGFDVAGTYGGHSPCVELRTGGPEAVILDMGSGGRALGRHLLGQAGGAPRTCHLFMSHLHWDHIMGFPFFAPVYVPGQHIVVHGCHERLEEAFRRQQAEPGFPVAFDTLAATIEFDVMQPGRTVAVAGLAVTPLAQVHGGDSYGYRFEGGGRTVVYSTDSEHKLEEPGERERFVGFFRDADLVIFDAMYSFAEAITVKADWGHSSNIVGVELCQAARAKRLCLFHHEPANDDAQIARILRETQRFEEITREGPRLEVIAAWDGLEIEL